ncbi:PrsW family intramembrane metalloprotease [Candidatus Micrarchaeota archaeon]|nr:PrsW family intramembrane metalloprotease [Candidatus Micrarchaeota archaeon]
MRILHLLVILLVLSSVIGTVYPYSVYEMKPSDKISINVTSTSLNSSPDNILVTVRVNNTDPESYIMYLMKVEGEELIPVKMLGVVQPYAYVTAVVNITVKYPGETFHRTVYGIVLTDNATEGKLFTLVEDWSMYESNVYRSLLQTHILVVPLITLIIILVLLLLIESAYHYRFLDPFGTQYTTENLFFPKVSGKPIGERIADMMMDPLIWVLEIGGCLLAFSYIINTEFSYTEFEITLFSGVAALLFPMIYLAFLWTLERRPLRFFFSMFFWGAFAAVLAFLGNYWLNDLVLPNFDRHTGMLISAVLIAPLVEELVKLMGPVLLSGHPEYRDSVIGLILGSSVGIGFSFIENWFYFASKTNPFELGLSVWMQLIIYRSFFNSLAHGFITGFGGALIGYVRSITHSGKYLVIGMVSAFLIVVPLHSLFNLTAMMDGTIREMESVLGLPFIFNPLFVMVLTVMFIVVYLISHKEYAEEAAEEVG